MAAHAREAVFRCHTREELESPDKDNFNNDLGDLDDMLMNN